MCAYAVAGRLVSYNYQFIAKKLVLAGVKETRLYD